MRIFIRTEKRSAVQADCFPVFFISCGRRFPFPPFLYGEILFTKVNPVGEACGPQSLHVFVNLRVGHLRINLRGGNGGMPHHAAYRLYRHAEREGDMSAEIMTSKVKWRK